MNQVTYSQKLASPEWQKRRLKIFERDNWTCQCCGSTTTQLEIHHTDYFAGMKPWDYPDDMLLTTCRKCHGEEQVRFQHEKKLLQALKSSGFYAFEILAIAQMLYTFKPFISFIRLHIKTFMKINDN